MTVTGPKVRDYTDTERRLDVEIEVSPAYELLLSLFAFGCEDRSEYEVGEEWFERTYATASTALQTGLDLILRTGEHLVGLLGIVHDLDQPKTVEAFLQKLASMDSVDLRLALLGEIESKLGTGLLRNAVAGDADAVRELLEHPKAQKHRRGISAILESDPDEFQDSLIETLRSFADDVLADHPHLMPILERDAAEKRAMAATLPPDRLVEMATNGVTFAMQPSVTGIVLIPSKVVRPWVVIAEHGSLRIFAYPVADESIADPGGPPNWLVGFYKALGDEKRMRILGYLAEAPKSLGDIAKHLDVSKSTAHHHVSMLRHAGLVRVTIGEEREYSIRTDAIPEASGMLQRFLTNQRQGD